MAAEEVYLGTWRIVECVSLAGTVETTGIEGTEFVLDEGGDVSWKVSDEAETLPFFNCETYELVQDKNFVPKVIKFIGSYAGLEVNFKVEVSDDLMLLTYERCCMLQCQKVSPPDPKDDVPFSFLGALEEGYFTDVVIKADSGREYRVHSTILSLTAPAIEWTKSPTPLTGLPEDVLQATLHYIYAECLPRGMSEDTAQKCVKTMAKLPELTDFVKLCDTFLKNTALKQQITNLVTDMHSSADKIIELFSGASTTEEGPGQSDLANNPAKLCYVVKQALREAAVAFSKLLILCDLFSRRKSELSREERHDIIKYAKSRIPVFMKQWEQFLEVCKTHTSTLSTDQRHEIATYLVPEIESSLELVTVFVSDGKAALEQMISGSESDKAEKADKGKKGHMGIESSLELVTVLVSDGKAALEQIISGSESDKAEKADKGKKGHVGDVLGRTLKNALHVRELKKLKKLHDRSTSSFFQFMQKKESFSLMSTNDKVRSISKLLEQLVDTVNIGQMKVQELIDQIETRLTWRDWKYIFKLGTSKISWAICKLHTNKHMVQALIGQACEIVHREQFTNSVLSLGLMELSTRGESGTSPTSQDSPGSLATQQAPAEGATSSTSCSSSQHSSHTTATTRGQKCKAQQPQQQKTKYIQLSSVESLSIPPYARDSRTALNAVRLLQSQKHTDLIFEIVMAQELGDTVIDHTGDGSPVEQTAGAEEEEECVEQQRGAGTTTTMTEVCEIPAHRVIIAARCDWFRRALLSGMRESIDRKITVHDTNPELFKLFLEYLYSGQLDMNDLATEQLADMMTLADRYDIVGLCSRCEHALKHHVDEDTVFYLLSLADHLTTKTLKEACMSYLAEHPVLTSSESFQDLPEHLQLEVETLTLTECPPNCTLHSHTDTPSSVSSMSEIDDMMNHVDIADRMNIDSGGTSSSSEDMLPSPDNGVLQMCIDTIADIVGDTIPREEIVQAVLAADYDSNRALNFLFA